MKTPKYLAHVIIGTVFLIAILIWATGDKNTEQGNEVTDKGEVAEETSKLNADIYPLYSGAEWGSEVMESGEVRVTSEPFTDVTNIQAVSEPFTEYYHQKLTASRWEQDIMREASGPGSNVSYYVKDDQFVIIGFESDFKVRSDVAPSECPCDVTFSIVNGTE